jgi:hypothetical protein
MVSAFWAIWGRGCPSQLGILPLFSPLFQLITQHLVITTIEPPFAFLEEQKEGVFWKRLPLECRPVPEFMRTLVAQGGLIPYTRAKLNLS